MGTFIVPNENFPSIVTSIPSIVAPDGTPKVNVEITPRGSKVLPKVAYELSDVPILVVVRLVQLVLVTIAPAVLNPVSAIRE